MSEIVGNKREEIDFRGNRRARGPSEL